MPRLPQRVSRKVPRAGGKTARYLRRFYRAGMAGRFESKSLPGWATVPPPRNREGGFDNGEILGPGKLLIPSRFRSDVVLDPSRVKQSRDADHATPLARALTIARVLLGDRPGGATAINPKTGKAPTLADISKTSPRSASQDAARQVSSLVRRPRVRAGLGWGNGAVTNNPSYADEANQPGMSAQPLRLAPKRRTRSRSGGGARAM